MTTSRNIRDTQHSNSPALQFALYRLSDSSIPSSFTCKRHNSVHDKIRIVVKFIVTEQKQNTKYLFLYLHQSPNTIWLRDFLNPPLRSCYPSKCNNFFIPLGVTPFWIHRIQYVPHHKTQHPSPSRMAHKTCHLFAHLQPIPLKLRHCTVVCLTHQRLTSQPQAAQLSNCTIVAVMTYLIVSLSPTN